MKDSDSKNWIPDQVGNDNLNRLPQPINRLRNDKIKVAIGMSGGVDSSVAAKLLKDQGYEVVGFMMKLWPGSQTKCSRDNACCDIDGLQDAKRIAAILDIPFYVVDVREKFKKEVADYFIEEYKNLRTPNPCVKCNEKIKFGWLLDFAKSVGCDFLATGHYARIVKDNSRISNSKFLISNQIPNNKCLNNQNILGCHSEASAEESQRSFADAQDDKENAQDDNITYHLLRGVDEQKDQSYFLYRLNQDQLSRILFPVGDYTKEEVRAMAKKWDLPVYEKKESQEICFIQEKDYREFLRKNIPEDFFKPGDIVDLTGNVIGRHQGLINYTIGQRRGIEQSKALRISKSKFLISNQISNSKCQNSKNVIPAKVEDAHRGAGIQKNTILDPRVKPEDDEVKGNKTPLYAIGFNLKENRLIVGKDQEVFSDSMTLTDLNWIDRSIKYQVSSIKGLKVKIRYRHPAVEVSGIRYQVSGNLEVKFREHQRAITPGQSAVFYLPRAKSKGEGDEILGGGIISE